MHFITVYGQRFRVAIISYDDGPSVSVINGIIFVRDTGDFAQNVATAAVAAAEAILSHPQHCSDCDTF